MMHLQAKPNITEPTSDLADAWASLKKPALRAPPGLSLEPEDNEPAAPAAKPGAMKLSLADLCSGTAKSGSNKIRPPPGFDDILNGEVISLRFDGDGVLFDTGSDQVVEAPPGLPAPMKKGLKKGIDSEETSAGSDSDPDSTPGSDSNKGMSISLDMMLTDVSHLKASSPLFVPKLSAETAAMLPAIPQTTPTQRTPLRTSLRSLKTADAYVPSASALPFVPMSAVENAWENWHMQNSNSPTSYDCQAEYANDTSAEWETDYGYSADYYPEQEWAY